LYSNSYLDLNEQFIANRVEEGFCRDCHGDLHSKNIFLYKDPIIFDCIEFNDDFRQIDVLNELAFFCMDLEAYERWDLSKQFMESYLELFPCMMGMKGEQLFKYFKCYRASVRAKVNTLRAMQADNEYDENKYNIEVKKYLKLMANYMDE
jgi:aminoglycoside phosphotransferase family enzyme